MAIFSVYKKRCDFLGSLKKQGFFGVLYLSPAQINNNIIAIYCLVWDSGGYAKNVAIFLGRQILKLRFLGYENMNLCRTPVPTVGSLGLKNSWEKESFSRYRWNFVENNPGIEVGREVHCLFFFKIEVSL